MMLTVKRTRRSISSNGLTKRFYTNIPRFTNAFCIQFRFSVLAAVSNNSRFGVPSKYRRFKFVNLKVFPPLHLHSQLVSDLQLIYGRAGNATPTLIVSSVGTSRGLVPSSQATNHLSQAFRTHIFNVPVHCVDTTLFRSIRPGSNPAPWIAIRTLYLWVITCPE